MAAIDAKYWPSLQRCRHKVESLTAKGFTMSKREKSIIGVSLLALLGGVVHAQEAAPVAEAASVAEADTVVVTGEAVARGNNVITADRLEGLPAAQNIVDAIKLVPGVQIRGGDSSNNDPWSYAINIRGFEVNLRNSKIGQTLDGVPLFNASYYLGGAPAQKFVMGESLSQIQVNQGTADVGSPSSAALGGTIAYLTRDPSAEAGGLVRATLGDYDSRRFFGRYDFGTLFGNTQAYVAVSDLNSHLWPHGGSTPAAIEQFAVEGKSITDLGALNVTLYGSHNESDDDPIIEATRAFIESTNYSVDGSSSVFNTENAVANEYWADEWAAVRDNTFGYAKFDFEVNDNFSFSVTPYAQRNEGIGEFLPPGSRPRFNTAGGNGALVQVLNGGSEIRTTRTNAAGRSVLPYNGAAERVYTSLDGVVVRSSECFNADNTPRLSNGLTVCSSAQSYRNSEYYHKRLGAVTEAELDLGDHTIRGGIWYENLDRDFSRTWRNYIDIRQGPAATGPVYRRDFEQNFKTDLYKFHLADDWAVTDKLLVSLGLQHYLVDIEGTSAEAANFNSAGQQISTTRLAVNSDSSDLLPSIGAVYDVNDQLQVFGGFSKNFGAIGDWALEKTGTDLKSLEPETSQNFEAGLRIDTDRLRAAATVYRNDYDNAIVFLTNDFAVGVPGINYAAGTGGTYFNIDGGLESTGIEGSVEVDVTEALTAYAAASFINSEYTTAFRAASYGGNPVIVPAGAKASGTPDMILSGALDYQQGPFSGVLSVRHVGEAPGDAANTANLFVDAYTLVDASARYRIDLDGGDGRFIEFGVAVNNLTDEKYIGGILDEFTQRYVVGAPRSVSFTASLGF